VPRVAREVAATGVHVSSDHAPYGRTRDERVREALGDVPLVATGSPYGITPGVLRKEDGTPFRVYSPYARAWRARGLHSPPRRRGCCPGPTATSPRTASRPTPTSARRAARGR
jgi:deoxyribodipyrimidine photo-lyase